MCAKHDTQLANRDSLFPFNNINKFRAISELDLTPFLKTVA